jgi:probable rRNA maturation factor
VLSFPLYDFGEEEEEIAESENVALGDIVISLERAYEQAEEFGHSFAREVCFLAVHSTLHLIGYDHEVSEYDEKYMNETQEKILAKMGLHRK